MPKYFIEPEFITGDSIILSSRDKPKAKTEATTGIAHHLIHVLRIRVGDAVTLCDGRNRDYHCRVLSVETSPLKVSLSLEACVPCQTEPEVRVTLFQSMPKADKLEWIVQKCVELGVYSVVPVVTQRSVVRKNEMNMQRYNRIAEAAAGQSMRGIVPLVHPPVPFAYALKHFNREALTIVAYERERTVTLKQILLNQHPVSVGLWIGPEGGFAEEEAESLCKLGGVRVSLGARVLRTETAAVSALAQTLCLLEA